MRARKAARYAGYGVAGFGLGLVAVSATVDSPRLERFLRRIQLDVNPVPIGLLVGITIGGLDLARRRNRRLR